MVRSIDFYRSTVYKFVANSYCGGRYHGIVKIIENQEFQETTKTNFGSGATGKFESGATETSDSVAAGVW